MGSTTLENLTQAMQLIDQEFKDNILKNTWPRYCNFLPQKPNIQVETQIEQFDEGQKYCYKRAVFPIEVPYSELRFSNKPLKDSIKEKLDSKKLNSLKNQDGLEININEIKIIHWMEFLKHSSTSTFRVDFLGAINERDSYQIYLSIYYE